MNGADGAYCFIDQNEPQYAFVSSQNGNFRRLLNWVNNGSVIGGSTGEFINPADYDDQENILYTVIKNSNTKLNRISNATGSVQREQLDISVSGSVTHIRVSPYTDAGKSNIFLGTGGGQVIYITDADDDGLAQSVDLNIPGFGSISCVEIGRDDKELLVTRYGYGVTSVYYTKDAGVNWVEVEGNLPNMPVRWALFNPTNRNEVILATEVGVWGTSNVNAESVVWTPQINGMANVRVDMLQYRTSDNQVLATTHGRGMFTSEAFNILDPLQVDFKADQIYVNPGEPVNFTNLSNGFSDGFEWYFEGAETTNFTGETPPAIRYVNSGCFQVTLTGTRDTASVISDKTCYIHVSPTACEDIFSYNVEPDSVFMTIPTIDSANFSLDLYDQDGFNVSSSLAGNGYNSNWIIKDLRGNNVYAATSRFSPKGKADNWIIFGPITIPTQRAMLHWKHIMYFNALRDGYDVLATVSGNTVNDFKQNGIKLLSYKDNDDKTLGHSSLTYNEVSIAPSLLGQQVYFAFRHTAEEMYVLGLDEFGVSVCDEISPIAPVADFKADSLNIKMGETTNLTDLSTNFTTSWTWDFDGGIGNINEQHPTVLFNEPGCKKIMLWSTNEAGTDSTSKTCYINVKDVTSIQSYASETIMTTFPNPFSNKLNLKAKQKDLKIRVFNAAGAIIMTTEIPAMELAINTQEWSSGLYVIEITSGAHREVQKLMKE